VGALTVTVRSGACRTSYPIRIGRGLAGNLGRALAGLAGADRAIVVSSPRVWTAVGPRVAPGLSGMPVVLVPDGGSGSNTQATLMSPSRESCWVVPSLGRSMVTA